MTFEKQRRRRLPFFEDLSFLSASSSSQNTPVSLRNFVSRKFRSIALGFWSPFLIHESIETNRWQGLSRYFTQLDTVDRDRSDEYARWSTLLETPVFEMSYYWDVPGVLGFGVTV